MSDDITQKIERAKRYEKVALRAQDEATSLKRGSCAACDGKGWIWSRPPAGLVQPDGAPYKDAWHRCNTCFGTGLDRDGLIEALADRQNPQPE